MFSREMLSLLRTTRCEHVRRGRTKRFADLQHWHELWSANWDPQVLGCERGSLSHFNLWKLPPPFWGTNHPNWRTGRHPLPEFCPLRCQKSLRGPSIKIGTIERRLAWPLRMDDTHKSRNVVDFSQYVTIPLSLGGVGLSSTNRSRDSLHWLSWADIWNHHPVVATTMIWGLNARAIPTFNAVGECLDITKSRLHSSKLGGPPPEEDVESEDD